MAKPKKLANGRWQIRPRYKDIVTGEWIGGKRTFDTAAEARAYEAHVIAEANMGHSSKTVTLGKYYAHWLELYKKPFVEKRTISRVEVDMKHALTFFTPGKQLDMITKANYQLWLNTEARTHSHETVRTMHTTFKSMMENAVDEGIILRNPCVGARFTGVTRKLKHPKQTVLDIHDYKLLLNQILQSPDCASKYACIVQAFTGMRIGELLGLTWSKINASEHKILIDGQYDYMENSGRIHLKDHTRPREITVEASLFGYLNDYRHWEQTSVYGSKVVPMSQYLFIGDDGLPITPNAVNKFLDHQCQKAGVTRITSHAWRRTQATMMRLAKLDDKFIAGFLGHTVETLEKYYVKETDDLKRENLTLRQAFLTDQGII